ncbi:hypothetical protein LSUCC0031_13165 [Rhodobacterales bacterium LSUCC0031]|nr:hypothetical protein [Rhodobacterales bacterium LSUCC0031]
MRLTCPNCGARYEVADSMIPADGRDVQCSNCATTWFQPGLRIDAGQVAATEAEVAPEEVTPPQPSPTVTEEQIDPPEDASRVHAPDVPPPTAAPLRQEIDPAIRDILREEAAREVRLRQAEAPILDDQPEMALASEPVTQATRSDRPELDRAVDAFDLQKTTVGRVVAARELFPDIEQINATLRDSADRSAQEGDASDIDTLHTIPRRRRGVRIGFFLVLALAGAAVALYAYADPVIAQVPALADMITAYVAMVNDGRFWLDDLAKRLADTAQ